MASSSQAQSIYSGPTHSQGGAAFNGNLHAARNININHITTVRPLARSLYRSCLASSDLFKDIRNELVTLLSALEATEETCMELGIDVSNHPTLCHLSQSSHQVLQDFQDLKTRFDNMGAQTQGIWERSGLGAEELADIRQTIASHTGTLNLFNTNMINSSQARVKQMLKKFFDEIRTERRKGSVMSTQTIDSLSPDDRESWRQLRKELESVGITPALFTEHHSFIVATLQKAIHDGDLEEDIALDRSNTAESGQETLFSTQPISLTTTEASAKLPDTSIRRPSSQDPYPKETSSNEMPKKGNLRFSKITSRIMEILYRFTTTKRFLEAASTGDAILTQRILERKRLSSGNLGHALLKASRHGHVEVVKLLLARSVIDVNFKDRMTETPLSWAAVTGDEVIVKLLLARSDVDINPTNFLGMTPLLWAARWDNNAIVKLLLARSDVDINHTDFSGYTPLSAAAQNGLEAVVKLLLACSNIDINHGGYARRTPLFWAARNGYEAVVKLLLAHSDIDANRGAYFDWRWTPGEREGLHVSATLRLYSDVNDANIFGWTPLLCAAIQGHKVIVKLLLAHLNIQVDSKDNFERTFSLLAARSGHKLLVRQIFKGFADLRYPDDEAFENKDAKTGYYREDKDAKTGYYWIIRWVLASFDE